MIHVNNFKVILRMCGLEDAIPVHFKPDGGRFKKTNTVKLIKDTDYSVSFNTKPAMNIAKLMINGELHRLELVNGKSNDEVSNGRTYKTLFTTKGFELTKSGKRREILIVIELENGVYMRVTLQCKVYAPGDKSHAQWGDKLSMIDMDCSLDPAHNYVTILKEKYL
ncbi:CB1 cannabinoid receptor-interacting protein 1-like isoform X2 [Dreissena polymorpha]|nr:CB1 cannabinoid receptor-interacting protein 1-like isoform X2 [Dreissena polymorpha]